MIKYRAYLEPDHEFLEEGEVTDRDRLRDRAEALFREEVLGRDYEFTLVSDDPDADFAECHVSLDDPGQSIHVEEVVELSDYLRKVWKRLADMLDGDAAEAYALLARYGHNVERLWDADEPPKYAAEFLFDNRNHRGHGDELYDEVGCRASTPFIDWLKARAGDTPGLQVISVRDGVKIVNNPPADEAGSEGGAS
jgi:hypothetical protein